MRSMVSRAPVRFSLVFFFEGFSECVPFVDAQHGIKSAGADIEGGEVREEVVAHEVAEENKVVDKTL